MSLAGFSDADLYEKLGFAFPPTDRELEVRTLFLRRKYAESGDSPNETLYAFYDLVYDHFFSDAEGNRTDGAKEDETEVEGYQDMASIWAKKQTTPPKSDADGTGMVAVVSNIPYSRDKMNPLLKQTIQRVVSIDSKYRNLFSGSVNKVNNANSNSTNFTIDLSEPLKDVLSIKLYSFQIPNSWYTIAKNYGANFFLLQGTSPGINTGNFDYKVMIDAGNYTTTALIQAVSASIQALKTTYTDVSFGNSDLSMNPANTLATLTWDYKNSFDQSNYYLDWAIVPDPSRNNIVPGQTTLFHDIPSFLGFANRTYSLSELSTPSLNYPGTLTDKKYLLDSYNNSFVIQTVGPGGQVDFSLNIVLTLDTNSNTDPKTGPNTRSVIAAAVQKALQGKMGATGPLDSKTSFTSVESVVGPNSFIVYTFQIIFNETVVPLYNLSNYQIVFPTENVVSPYFPIWTGENSCFQFDRKTGALTFTLNTLTSENSILTDSFPVSSPPVIKIHYTLANYQDPSNDFVFVCSDLSSQSYKLDQFIAGVNAAFTPYKYPNVYPDPHFQLLSGNVPFLSGTSKPVLRFDYRLLFQTYEYYVDLSQTVLGYLYYNINGTTDLSNDYLYDLSLNPVLSGSLTNYTNVYIPVDLSNQLLLIKPKFRRNGFVDGSNTSFAMTHGLSPGINFQVPFISSVYIIPQPGTGIPCYFYPGSVQYNNTLVNDINASLQAFVGNPVNYPIQTSVMSFIPVPNAVDLSLSLFIQNLLSEIYSSVSLYDQATGIDISSSWTRSFGFSSTPYDLSLAQIPGQNYSEISGNYIVNTALLSVDATSNFFYIRPLSFANGLTTTVPGVYPGDYYNDIRLEIPVGTYNTDSLIIVLNNALKSNPLTLNSSFCYVPPLVGINEPQYAQFQFLVKKTFTANDYSLVFYNSSSFFQCLNTDASIRNTTWDQTLGWMLGFRQTSYPLSLFPDPKGGPFAIITGENTVNVNLFSYLLITLDDFNQCRLNDGLVSITKPDASVSLPSYAAQTQFNCSEGTTMATGSTNSDSNNLTLNQVYALNQILAARSTPVSQSFSEGPYIKDIFGIIPLKTAGLGNGQLYSDYGGSLGTQERIYFGPVNIRRLQVQLYNNQGSIMDLNNADWSFSFICEQLYQQNSGDPSAKKD